MNNLDYFEASTTHKEGLIDPDYHLAVDRRIIPLTKEENNELTTSNLNVIRYISSVQTMIEDLGFKLDDPKVEKTLSLIVAELNTKGMNFSAFCQYFNVHNMNYSVFQELKYSEKIEVLKFIIKPYIDTRHKMYESHGYSNIVLQVMSDNYSHKRKGTYGTNKISFLLESLSIQDLMKKSNKSFNQDTFFLLSDKTGKAMYKKFALMHGIKLHDEGKATEKYPDAFIKIGKHYFIVEQKNMKENGGGQDKQTVEITDFISRTPEFEGLHYVTFIDGIYFNQIDKNATAKTLQQYTDIIGALAKYKSNYFVNSFGFKKLISDYLYENFSDSIIKLINN